MRIFVLCRLELETSTPTCFSLVHVIELAVIMEQRTVYNGCFEALHCPKGLLRQSELHVDWLPAKTETKSIFLTSLRACKVKRDFLRETVGERYNIFKGMYKAAGVWNRWWRWTGTALWWSQTDARQQSGDRGVHPWRKNSRVKELNSRSRHKTC